MKIRTGLSLILAVVFSSLLAAAQNQPATEKADPLVFVKIAADVAGNVQQQSLDGMLGIYISDKSWADAMKDGDLGPFLKLVETKSGRSAACVFASAKDRAVCVYFDGKSPFGVAAAKNQSGGALQPSDLPAEYKAVSKDMLKKGNQEWHFAESAVNTDAGVALPAFGISN